MSDLDLDYIDFHGRGGTLRFGHFYGELEAEIFTVNRYHWGLFNVKILDISIA